MLLFHPLKALHDSFQWQGCITGRRNWRQVFYLFNLVAVQTVGSEVSLSKSALLQKFTNYWLFSVVAARYLNNVHGQQEGKKLRSLPCYPKHCLMLKQRDNIKCPFFIWRLSWLSTQTCSNLIVHKSKSSFNNRKKTFKNENKMRIKFAWQLEITLKEG